MTRFLHVPLSRKDAFAYVGLHHRHHDAPQGYKFAIAAVARAARTDLLGVAIVGRPVARGLDDGRVLEVTRLCVPEGRPHVCSFLYAAAARAVAALGYDRVATYTLESESGVSLRAAGWARVAEVRGRAWSCSSRPRGRQPQLADWIVKAPEEPKVRWERVLRVA